MKEWPEDGPKLLWKVTDIGKGWSGVAVADGTVYITGDVDDKLMLFAFDLDGQLKWKVDNGDKCDRGGYTANCPTPTYSDGYVFWANGYLYGNDGGAWKCLDLKTGEKKWSERAVGKGSVCWADGMLYLFSENDGQAALATCSPEGLEIKGKVKVDGEGPSWAHPVVIGGRLYLRYDKNLYCFDVKSR